MSTTLSSFLDSNDFTVAETYYYSDRPGRIHWLTYYHSMPVGDSSSKLSLFANLQINKRGIKKNNIDGAEMVAGFLFAVCMLCDGGDE